MQNCLSELEFWELIELHRFCCFIFAQIFIDNQWFVLGFLHFCRVFVQKCLSELEFWELVEFVALHRFCCFIFAQGFIDNQWFVL